MSKRRDQAQLDLDLSGQPTRRDVSAKTGQMQVISFVDATTLRVRQDALRRVAASGIFKLPQTLRRD